MPISCLCDIINLMMYPICRSENRVQFISVLWELEQMLKQKEMPAVGEKIAVIKTDKGDIKVRLFPEEAPKAVENFVTHAENG